MTQKVIGKEYPRADEAQLIDEMMREMKRQVDALYEDKKMLRQVHTKMHGCVKGYFTIEEKLTPQMQAGIFIPGHKYSCYVRFSNASTQPKPDGKKDIRGVAIKLLDVPGEKMLASEKELATQDFLLMSSETFFSKNIEEFRSVMKALTAKSKLHLLGYMLNPFHWGVARRMVKGLVHCEHVAGINYWSTQPYRFGAQEQAVKYKLVPKTDNKLLIENTSDADYLRINLAQTLNSHALEFDFYIQFQLDADRMPIEDPTVPWESPFHKVATLHLFPQRFDSEEQWEVGENMSFNPWHSLPAHQPLGSFNRARKVAYEGMSRYRHDKNGLAMTEPTSANFDSTN